MTITTFSDYPEKGTYGADIRRNLNAAIHQYTMDVIESYPAYATTTWYIEKYTPLVEQGDFGKDHAQVIQAQLCLLGLPARGSHKAFYQELVEFIPYLGVYLTLMNRSWELKEATKEAISRHDFAAVVELPTTTPTRGITTALEEHKAMMESTLRGLEGAAGVATGGRRNLQGDFNENDDDDENEDDDEEEEEEVLDFNNKLTSPDDNDDNENVKEKESGKREDDKKRRAQVTGLSAGDQITLTQLTDPDSVARTMLKSKHLEKVIAKAARTSAITATATAESALYTKLQGKITEQEAVNRALKDSIDDQNREMTNQKAKAAALQQRLDAFIKKTMTNPAAQVTSTPAVKQHPNSLSELHNRKLAEDYLRLNPNKNSNKFLNYYHDGMGWTMQPQNYADSRLPKMKIKYYVDTIGLMRNFTIHAAQFGIFIHQIEDVKSWDDRNANPPTCPYNPDITHQCDKVYTLAANKIYTKLANTIDLQHPVLKQSFTEAGQFADGYIALYYLQSYGNPKFVDRSIEMPKPELGNSRDISLFCRNLHNYSMYKALIGDKPTKLNMYEYAISQINANFPDEYSKGIKEVEDKINVWRALSKNPAIGPTQPFPHDAEIEGSKLAFAIMRKYTEQEARTLFQEDGYDNEDEVIIIDKAEVKAAKSSRYQKRDTEKPNYNNFSRGDKSRNQNWQRNEDGKKKSYHQRSTPNTPRTTQWKYREGVYCSICGSEGHEATEDGCFATGRFLRLIKGLDQTLYRRIKQKYGDLVKSIDRKLQDSIDQRTAKRKERNAKINMMELADKAWEMTEDEDDARQICINCAYAVFPNIDEDSSEEDFADAESS